MVNLAVIVQVFLVELKDGHNKFMVECGVQQLEVVVVMAVAVVVMVVVVAWRARPRGHYLMA